MEKCHEQEGQSVEIKTKDTSVKSATNVSDGKETAADAGENLRFRA